jgi:hypothetical protein
MLLDLSKFTAPYNISVSGNAYTFTTDCGNEYIIRFKDSTPDYQHLDIGDSIIYEYQFFRTCQISDEADARISDTILHSLGQAIVNTKVVVYFICDDEDERELIRHKLFNIWYMRYGKNDFIKLDGQINYGNGIEYSSVLIHRENPDCEKLIGVFNEMLESLKDKINNAN